MLLFFARNMQATTILGFLLSTLLTLCWADVYLHFPGGSNNRLNGNGVNVRNPNGLFDSQVGVLKDSLIIYMADGI